MSPTSGCSILVDLILVLLSQAMMSLSPPPARSTQKQTTIAPNSKQKLQNAAAVGSDSCIQCHEDEGRYYQATRHHRPFLKSEPKPGCESCHGNGGLHVADPTANNIWNAKDLAAFDSRTKSTACLSCHRSNLRPVPNFFFSRHAESDVSCWDCHQELIHTTSPPDWQKTERSSRLSVEMKDRISNPFSRNKNENCFRCHDDKRMEFVLQFHHPIERGKMYCVDCHNPHGDKPYRFVLTDSISNETDATCFKCHSEQRGPFVWPHRAMENGCTACHKPHGSVNRKLLKFSGNMLCLQCHYETSFPTIGSIAHGPRLGKRARCIDCHLRPHGSNVSEDLTQ